MSPSAVDFEQQIGRKLKPGDVLISYEGASFEIIDPLVEAGRGRSRFGRIIDSESMGYKLLTPQGVVTTKDALERSYNAFSDIIKRENRKDISLIQKVIYRIKK